MERRSLGMGSQCNSNSSSTCNLGQPLDYAPLVDREEEEEECTDQFPLRQALSESNLLEFSTSENAAGVWGKGCTSVAVFSRLELKSPVPVMPSPLSLLLPFFLSSSLCLLHPSPYFPHPSSHLPSFLLVPSSPTDRCWQKESGPPTDRPPTEEWGDCETVTGAKKQNTL